MSRTNPNPSKALTTKRAALRSRLCLECGMYFEQDGTQHKRKFCSQKCKQRHYRRMKSFRDTFWGDSKPTESAPTEQITVKDRAIETLYDSLKDLTGENQDQE